MVASSGFILQIVWSANERYSTGAMLCDVKNKIRIAVLKIKSIPSQYFPISVATVSEKSSPFWMSVQNVLPPLLFSQKTFLNILKTY